MTDSSAGRQGVAETPDGDNAKAAVINFWQEKSCGEVYAHGPDAREALERQFQQRYKMEPYLEEFARFPDCRGLDVLEIGLGMGADHLRFAQQLPRSLIGVDLTPRAVEWTRERLSIVGLSSSILVADAESLPFRDQAFDLIYSWGVLHHTPDTATAFGQVRRLLRPGGRAKIMVYHSKSIVGYLLWIRYALMAGKPRHSLADVYAQHLESPGTKAYSVQEVKNMLQGFSEVHVKVQMSSGDLLLGRAGERHQNQVMRLARRVWPRQAIKRFLPGHGLCLLVDIVR